MRSQGSQIGAALDDPPAPLGERGISEHVRGRVGGQPPGRGFHERIEVRPHLPPLRRAQDGDDLVVGRLSLGTQTIELGRVQIGGERPGEEHGEVARPPEGQGSRAQTMSHDLRGRDCAQDRPEQREGRP